jgi:2-polyprenyl-3-methyl-5-hydroxy-6-metoxy-1,4-benzoquinol methylase
MKLRALDFLACPVCHGDFDLRNAAKASSEASEIASGALVCPQGHAFEIKNGVPRLRLDQKLDKAPVQARGDSLSVAASFGAEWGHFDYEQDRTWHQSVDERRQLFLKEVAISASELPGKVVLDAGCGNGSLSVGISKFGCEVLAIDVSESVDVAYRHFARQGNDRTYFVQGDLMNPPFKRDVFDVIFSSGVLHHNPDTRQALGAIAQSLAPGGRIYIWVYGHVPGVVHKLKEVFRRAISPMPSAIKHAIVGLWLPQAMVRQCIRTALGRNKPQDRLKWSERFVLLLDHYTPRYRWEHTPDEVMGWYRELGYEKISQTEDRDWGFGCAASKPPKVSVTVHVPAAASPVSSSST